jgi:hypothetical protein
MLEEEDGCGVHSTMLEEEDGCGVEEEEEEPTTTRLR